ncbi:hypothetical protein TEA_012620 [Camellia sinensis var. sinensis]|uniref:Disease resistance protein At4g27190-like leucine-rich repeats domain-containing protein n=1 Tax=Camellia sinensis var. sinensis TaxID=542762 RepID=A0A4S4EZ55_CAMSN|nr:hypothetical protein TEA_012620 [Camellia sinensis var. sinensis]
MAMESVMAVVPYLTPAIENLESLLKNEVALLWGAESGLYSQLGEELKADICFQMHDLAHELAQSIMKDECEMIKFNSSSNISNEKVRHVTLVVRPGENFNNTFHKVVSLRTLLLQSTFSLEDDELLCDFRKFGSLRAFDAGARRMKELPSSIGNLKHLSLLAELKCLNLGGELRIEHLVRVSNPMDAKEANLVGKQNLWNKIKAITGKFDAIAANRSKFHLKEKQVEYDNCGSAASAPWLLKSISNLNSLTSLIVGYDKETVCFPTEFLRNLTLLESLVIKYCEGLKVLSEDLASLGTFKSLAILRCPKLESFLEERLRSLESLQSLHINYCPKITSLPASIQSLTKLQRIDIWHCSPELKRSCEKGNGEDWYKIVHILDDSERIETAPMIKSALSPP